MILPWGLSLCVCLWILCLCFFTWAKLGILDLRCERLLLHSFSHSNRIGYQIQHGTVDAQPTWWQSEENTSSVSLCLYFIVFGKCIYKLEHDTFLFYKKNHTTQKTCPNKVQKAYLKNDQHTSKHDGKTQKRGTILMKNWDLMFFFKIIRFIHHCLHCCSVCAFLMLL